VTDVKSCFAQLTGPAASATKRAIDLTKMQRSGLADILPEPIFVRILVLARGRSGGRPAAGESAGSRR